MRMALRSFMVPLACLASFYVGRYSMPGAEPPPSRLEGAITELAADGADADGASGVDHGDTAMAAHLPSVDPDDLVAEVHGAKSCLVFKNQLNVERLALADCEARHDSTLRDTITELNNKLESTEADLIIANAKMEVSDMTVKKMRKRCRKMHQKLQDMKEAAGNGAPPGGATLLAAKGRAAPCKPSPCIMPKGKGAPAPACKPCPPSSPLAAEANVFKPAAKEKCHPLPPGKKGVLRIKGGDVESGFATIFFLYSVNHIMYAEMNGLVPWMSLDQDQAKHVYDKRLGHNAFDAYYYPISNVTDTYKYCDAEVVELVYDCVWPWIHHKVPWAVRAWYYGREESLHNETAFDEPWFRNNRLRASQIINRMFRPREWVTERVDALWKKMFPVEGIEILGMHMRGTDKAAGRRKVEPTEYLHYAQKFLEAYPTGKIYLATDDSGYKASVLKSWPAGVLATITSLPDNKVHRSGDEGPDSAIFRLDGVGHQETNIEVLTDILLLARCTGLLYGASAVAEAAIYMNPLLHWNSVHLEYKHGRQTPVWMQKLATGNKGLTNGPYIRAPYGGPSAQLCPAQVAFASEEHEVVNEEERDPEGDPEQRF